MSEKKLFDHAPWRKPSAFETKKKELESQGYAFAGQEHLTTVKFQEDARFKTVPLQTKEEVIQKLKDHYKDQTEIDVVLVDQEGLEQNQKAVYVFIRPKKNI